MQSHRTSDGFELTCCSFLQRVGSMASGWPCHCLNAHRFDSQLVMHSVPKLLHSIFLVYCVLGLRLNKQLKPNIGLDLGPWPRPMIRHEHAIDRSLQRQGANEEEPMGVSLCLCLLEHLYRALLSS